MRRETITVTIGENESMRVEAYMSSTEGLAIHRQVAYLPGKEEHKFTSKWQITHVRSGTALLKPGDCLATMSRAKAVAEKLADELDWTLERPQILGTDARARLIDALAEAETDMGIKGLDEPVSADTTRRYLVRRNPDGPGYVVWDDAKQEPVENGQFLHRGLASDHAKDLNGSVST